MSLASAWLLLAGLPRLTSIPATALNLILGIISIQEINISGYQPFSAPLSKMSES